PISFSKGDIDLPRLSETNRLQNSEGGSGHRIKIIAGLFCTQSNFIPNMSSPSTLIFQCGINRSSPIFRVAGVAATSLPIVLTSRLNGEVVSAGNSVFHQRKGFNHNQCTSDPSGFLQCAGLS